MPLINLLQECAKAFGDSLSDPASKAVLLSDVNTAANRIWDDYDLIGSIREETFKSDVNEALNVLPWYVNRLRGAKLHSTRQKINLVNLGGYYQTYAYFQSPFQLRVAAPCVTFYNLDIASQLTVKLLAAETNRVKVTIVGTTGAGFTVKEDLIFNPGETTKTTTNQFRATGNNPVRDALKSITRSTVTSSDTVIYDLSGRVLSFIPGRRQTAEFTIIQLYDQLRFVIDQGFDILYKLPYLQFVDDGDTMCNDMYNDAIYNKFLANRFRRSKMEDSIVRAQDADNKCAEIIGTVTSNFNGPIDAKLDFGQNNYLNVIQPVTNPRGFGPYGDYFGYGLRG